MVEPLTGAAVTDRICRAVFKNYLRDEGGWGPGQASASSRLLYITASLSPAPHKPFGVPLWVNQDLERNGSLKKVTKPRKLSAGYMKPVSLKCQHKGLNVQKGRG